MTAKRVKPSERISASLSAASVRLLWPMCSGSPAGPVLSP
jgi:hypothetical protein